MRSSIVVCLTLSASVLVGCASSGEDSELAIVLESDGVEGGEALFVTFELGDEQDAPALTVSPALRLRREGQELNVLIARGAGFDNYSAINGPATSPPPGSLRAGTRYRYETPDIEPGFHELCATYAIGGTPGQVCTELALT